jgi:hypothetical protein
MMTMFKQRFRLPGWDYSSSDCYFVTLCTKNKQCFLRRAADGRILVSEAGIISENVMKAIPNHYDNVVIDRYAIMLNHVHALIVIEDRHAYSPDPVETGLALFPEPLSQIVGGDKSGVTRSCPPGGLLDCWTALGSLGFTTIALDRTLRLTPYETTSSVIHKIGLLTPKHLLPQS